MTTINTSEIDDFLKSNSLEKFCSVSPKQLEDITEAIRRGIEYNLEEGQTVTGASVKPLSPYTVELKGFSTPFLDTGLLLNSVFKTINGDVGEVFIGSARAEIAAILNDGQGRIPARPFWGISEIVQKQIDEILLKDN